MKKNFINIKEQLKDILENDSTLTLESKNKLTELIKSVENLTNKDNLPKDKNVNNFKNPEWILIFIELSKFLSSYFT